MPRNIPQNDMDVAQISELNVLSTRVLYGEVPVSVIAGGAEPMFNQTAPYLMLFGMDERRWSFVRCIGPERVRLNGMPVETGVRVYLDTGAQGRDTITFPLFPQQRICVKPKYVTQIGFFIAIEWYQEADKD